MKKLSRRQQGEKRRKMFARNRKPAAAGSSGGRPPGTTTPFLEDRRRFEYAFWFFLVGSLKFPELEAARIAAAFFDRRSLFEMIEELRNGERYVGIGATYQGGLDTSANALEDKANYLLRHSKNVIKRLDKAGSNWITESAGALTVLFRAVSRGDAKEAAEMVELLRDRGWDRGLLQRAFARA
jgi:hypothetical protein